MVENGWMDIEISSRKYCTSLYFWAVDRSYQHKNGQILENIKYLECFDSTSCQFSSITDEKSHFLNPCSSPAGLWVSLLRPPRRRCGRSSRRRAEQEEKQRDFCKFSGKWEKQKLRVKKRRLEKPEAPFFFLLLLRKLPGHGESPRQLMGGRAAAASQPFQDQLSESRSWSGSRLSVVLSHFRGPISWSSPEELSFLFWLWCGGTGFLSGFTPLV